MNPVPPIGTRVRMTAENSNWTLGEIGTVVAHHNGRDLSGVGCDRVSVVFDGRTDDYTAFPDAFVTVASAN